MGRVDGRTKSGSDSKHGLECCHDSSRVSFDGRSSLSTGPAFALEMDGDRRVCRAPSSHSFTGRWWPRTRSPTGSTERRSESRRMHNAGSFLAAGESRHMVSPPRIGGLGIVQLREWWFCSENMPETADTFVFLLLPRLSCR
jgi:hypothetical protein